MNLSVFSLDTCRAGAIIKNIVDWYYQFTVFFILEKAAGAMSGCDRYTGQQQARRARVLYAFIEVC